MWIKTISYGLILILIVHTSSSTVLNVGKTEISNSNINNTSITSIGKLDNDDSDGNVDSDDDVDGDSVGEGEGDGNDDSDSGSGSFPLPVAEKLIHIQRKQQLVKDMKQIARPKRAKYKRTKRPKIKLSFAEPPVNYCPPNNKYHEHHNHYHNHDPIDNYDSSSLSIIDDFAHLNVDSVDFGLPSSSYDIQPTELDFYNNNGNPLFPYNENSYQKTKRNKKHPLTLYDTYANNYNIYENHDNVKYNQQQQQMHSYDNPVINNEHITKNKHNRKKKKHPLINIVKNPGSLIEEQHFVKHQHQHHASHHPHHPSYSIPAENIYNQAQDNNIPKKYHHIYTSVYAYDSPSNILPATTRPYYNTMSSAPHQHKKKPAHLVSEVKYNKNKHQYLQSINQIDSRPSLVYVNELINHSNKNNHNNGAQTNNLAAAIKKYPILTPSVQPEPNVEISYAQTYEIDIPASTKQQLTNQPKPQVATYPMQNSAKEHYTHISHQSLPTLQQMPQHYIPQHSQKPQLTMTQQSQQIQLAPQQSQQMKLIPQKSLQPQQQLTPQQSPQPEQQIIVEQPQPQLILEQSNPQLILGQPQQQLIPQQSETQLIPQQSQQQLILNQYGQQSSSYLTQPPFTYNKKNPLMITYQQPMQQNKIQYPAHINQMEIHQQSPNSLTHQSNKPNNNNEIISNIYQQQTSSSLASPISSLQYHDHFSSQQNQENPIYYAMATKYYTVPSVNELPISQSNKQSSYDFTKTSYEVPLYEPYRSNHKEDQEIYPPNFSEQRQRDIHDDSNDIYEHNTMSSDASLINSRDTLTSNIRRIRKRKRGNSSEAKSLNTSKSKHILDAPELQLAYESEKQQKLSISKLLSQQFERRNDSDQSPRIRAKSDNTWLLFRGRKTITTTTTTQTPMYLSTNIIRKRYTNIRTRHSTLNNHTKDKSNVTPTTSSLYSSSHVNSKISINNNNNHSIPIISKGINGRSTVSPHDYSDKIHTKRQQLKPTNHQNHSLRYANSNLYKNIALRNTLTILKTLNNSYSQHPTNNNNSNIKKDISNESNSNYNKNNYKDNNHKDLKNTTKSLMDTAPFKSPLNDIEVLFESLPKNHKLF